MVLIACFGSECEKFLYQSGSAILPPHFSRLNVLRL
jgi:hypothetical protein